jgi:hypothetical protein
MVRVRTYVRTYVHVYVRTYVPGYSTVPGMVVPDGMLMITPARTRYHWYLGTRVRTMVASTIGTIPFFGIGTCTMVAYECTNTLAQVGQFNGRLPIAASLGGCTILS